MGRKNRKRPTTYNQNVAQEQLNNSVYVNEELNSPKCMSSAETVPKFFDSNRSIPIKSSLSDVFKRFVDHFTVRRPADTCPNCNASLRLPGSPFQLFPSPRPSISEQGVNSSNISDTDKNVHDDKADPKTTLQFMVKFMQRAPEDKKRIVDTLEFLSTSDSSHLEEFLEYVKLKEGQSTEIPKPGSPAPADPKPSYDSIEETCRDDVEVFVEASTLAKSNNGNKSIIPNRVILAAAKERREHASNLSLPTVPTKNIPMGKNDFVMSCANNRKLVRSSTVAVRLGNLSTPMRPLEARLQKRASLTGSSNANLDIADRNVAKRPNILMGRSQSTSGNHANYNQATSLTAADKEPTAALSLSLTECSSLNYNMAADQAALNFQELRTPDCSLSPQGTLISNNPQPCDSFALPPIAAFPPAPPPSSNNLNVPLAPPPPPPGLCGKTPPAPPPPPNGLFSVPLAPPPPPPGICGIKASPPLAPSPPPADLFRGIPPAPPPPPSICTGPAAPPPPPPGLCGGGPSPSTPLMLDGFLLPQVVKSEEIYHKTKKLQAVRWTRLAHAETQKKENIWSKPTQLEFTSDERDEIEATFEQPVFTPRVSLAPKRIKSDESVVEKSAEVCLDQQRNLQLEICLKKLRDLSVDDMVQKLESGDLEGVPISELDTLANVYPSNDELIKFSSLTREQVSSKPSILCFYAAKNPNLKLIIELIVLQNSVFTELQNYDEQVVSIEDAMKAARSDVIVDVLHKSLKYGNFINQGTSMAGAAGFKLASLPETLSIRGKGSYSNLCFADLLVNNMEFKKADIEKLIQRLDVLRKLKLSDVRDTILGSLRTSESLGKRLNRCEHEELISRYSNFLEEVLSKFRSLNLKIDELRAMEDSLNTYFCGDKETAEDICLVLSKSLSLLVEALNKKSTPKPRAMSLVTINSPCLSPIMNRESLTRRSFNPQKRVSSEEFQKIVADAQSQK